MRPTHASWQERLDRAGTHASLVVLARDFVALWTPAEIAEIPDACRPRVRDVGDIHHCTERLAAEYVRLSQSGASTDGLSAMVTFFQKCSERANAIGSLRPAQESMQRGSAA